MFFTTLQNVNEGEYTIWETKTLEFNNASEVLYV